MTFPEAWVVQRLTLVSRAQELQRKSSDGVARFGSTHRIHSVLFLLAIVFKLSTAPYQADIPATLFKQELGSPPG